MTLLELCDPLFEYICRLNRSARKGQAQDLGRVRVEIKNILDDMKSRAGVDARLRQQFDLVRLPLLFFVDFMIKESSLENARQWKELGFDENELAGDEKFFELLEEALADPSEMASERLGVFYTCMGLGFTGWYTGQPEYLRKKMIECSTRLRGSIDVDQSSRICPEAYEHVDTSDLVQPPGAKLVGIAVALLLLIILLFVVNVYLFKSYSHDLMAALSTITQYLDLKGLPLK